MMLPLAYVVHLMTPGKSGGETRSYQMANAIAANGVGIHVYGQVGPSAKWKENVFPRRLRTPFPVGVAQLGRDFIKNQIHVCIERYQFPPFNVGCHAQRLRGKPIVLEMHGFPIEEFQILARTPGSEAGLLTQALALVPTSVWRTLQRHLMQHVDHFIVTSLGTKEILQAEGVAGNKISVIYNCVDPDLFDPQPHNCATQRRQLSITDGDCLLLYAGSMIHEELEIVIDAVHQLRRSAPGLKLRLFGTDPGRRVANYARGSDLTAGVFDLHPPVPHDQMPALLAAADIVLAPYSLNSRRFRNGFYYSPLKILEALAMEKPVVTVDAAELRTVFGNLPNLFFARSGDSLSWTVAIDAARQSAGSDALRRGRQFVLDGFSWKDAAQAYLRVISAVTTQP